MVHFMYDKTMLLPFYRLCFAHDYNATFELENNEAFGVYLN